MVISDADVTDRLQRYKSDLQYPSSDVVHRHLLSGQPAALSEGDYFMLRRQVAMKFDVTAAEVLLVGSCRTGFTIVDKTLKDGRPRYSLCHPGSDLDLTLVSPGLFARVWEGVYEYSLLNRAWAADAPAAVFRASLFEGWFDPSKLPPTNAYATMWKQLATQLVTSEKYGVRRPTLRVYRDWSRLTHFQKIAVDQCKIELKRGG